MDDTNSSNEEICASDFFEMLTEYFWFHRDPNIQKSFHVYTRFREWEEAKPGEAFQESAELLEKERAFAALLSGLDKQAYQLWRCAMEQVLMGSPPPELNQP